MLAIIPDNFKANGQGVQESGNCSNTQQNANFPRKWHLAVILDFGKCRKTVSHNGKVLAMFHENFKAIGQGVRELSSGNKNGGGGGGGGTYRHGLCEKSNMANPWP